MSFAHFPGTLSMYLHHTEKGTYTLFGKDDYEPVPEEVWQDVTGDCEVRATGSFDDGLWMDGKPLRAASGYRLVKEQAYMLTPGDLISADPMGRVFLNDLKVRPFLRVERKR